MVQKLNIITPEIQRALLEAVRQHFVEFCLDESKEPDLDKEYQEEYRQYSRDLLRAKDLSKIADIMLKICENRDDLEAWMYNILRHALGI